MLTLQLPGHPNSPFHLDPNQEKWILYSEPGMMYNLTLKAMNPDGVAITDPVAVIFPATGIQLYASMLNFCSNIKINE